MTEGIVLWLHEVCHIYDTIDYYCIIKIAFVHELNLDNNINAET